VFDNRRQFYYYPQGGSTTPAYRPSPLQQSLANYLSAAGHRCIPRYLVKCCTALADPTMHRQFRPAKAIRVMQETQLSLTNRATHLCKCNWCGWPLTP